MPEAARDIHFWMASPKGAGQGKHVSLVPDDVFFEHLANRRFPASQFIRKPEQIDYLEEPGCRP